MALTDDLVSYWKMDEASGTRNDSHGTNHLSDNNTAPSAAGIINNGVEFLAGNGEFLSRADNASLSLGSDTAFYWSLWFKALAVTSARVLLNKGVITGPGDEYLLWINSGNLQFYIGNGSSSQFTTHGTTLSTGVWYFVEIWHDPVANLIGIAMNGSADVTASWSGGTQDTANELNIGTGANGNTGYCIDGTIDEVGFWKGRVLDSGERASLYNAGAGLSYDDFGGAPATRTNRLTLLGVG